MDVEHQWILLRSIEIRREEQPRFDHVAAAADVEPLPLCGWRVGEDWRAVSGYLLGLAGLAVKHKHFGHRIEARNALGDEPVAVVRTEAGAQRWAAFDLLDCARIQVERVDPAGSGADRMEHHVGFVQPDWHRGRVQRREPGGWQALQVRRHPPCIFAGERVDEEIGLRGLLRVAREDDAGAVRGEGPCPHVALFWPDDRPLAAVQGDKLKLRAHPVR